MSTPPPPGSAAGDASPPAPTEDVDLRGTTNDKPDVVEETTEDVYKRVEEAKRELEEATKAANKCLCIFFESEQVDNR